MLREFRKRKVGLLLADQSCSNVSPDVIRMTGSKLVFRTVDTTDRETVGGAMLFGEYEYEHVARLGTGACFFFAEGYHRPRLIQSVHLQEELPMLGVTPQYEEIAGVIAERDWFKDARRRISMAKLEWLKHALNELDANQTKTNKAVEALKRQQADKSLTHEQVQVRAAAIMKRMDDDIDRFHFEFYQPLMDSCRHDDSEELPVLREKIRIHFESTYQDSLKRIHGERRST